MQRDRDNLIGQIKTVERSVRGNRQIISKSRKDAEKNRIDDEAADRLGGQSVENNLAQLPEGHPKLVAASVHLILLGKQLACIEEGENEVG